MNMVVQLVLAGVIGLIIHKPLVWLAKKINETVGYAFERGTFMKRALQTLGLFLILVATFQSSLNEFVNKGTMPNLILGLVLTSAFGILFAKKIIDWIKNLAVDQHKGTILWGQSLLLGLFASWAFFGNELHFGTSLNTLVIFLGAVLYFYADYFLYDETLVFADPKGGFEH